MKDLNGKGCVVTGAARGLGAALAERFLKEGCRLLLCDVREQELEQTCAGFRQRFGAENVLGLRCDITDEAQVRQLAERAVQQWGRLDIFIANAGILVSGPITEFDAAQWRRVIEVNLVGVMLCMKHALRVMEQQRSGVFIEINSKSGKRGSFRNSAYAASKFGGIGLVQSAALEMADKGVRVNAICPGNLLDSPLWTESLFKQYAQNQGLTEEQVRQKYIGQVPMKRPCTYEDVCNVAVFLASDMSSYMTGQAINVTGGQIM